MRPRLIHSVDASSCPLSIEDGGFPQHGEIDEEMSQLEKDIRQLKIEYDNTFGAAEGVHPRKSSGALELIIKRYGERGGDMKFGQRFR